MAGSVEFKNIIPTRKIFQDIQKHMKSRVPMTGIVKDVEIEIKKKTKKGLSFKNTAFIRLTPIYKKRKSKLGLSSKPDMSFTGHMLRSMKKKVVSATHGKVFISEQNYPRNPKTGQRPRIDTKTLANIHNTGAGRMPKRTFMDINKTFKKKLLQQWYDKPILKILGRG